MGIINELNEVANAIREKNGSTALMQLKDMPQAIRNISGGGDAPAVVALGRTNLATHGIDLDETATTYDIMSSIVKIPSLKYAYSVKELFFRAVFPKETELVIDIPKCYDLTAMFNQAENYKKVKISGNINGTGVILNTAFNSSPNKGIVEEIDFTGFCLNVVEILNPFMQQRKLRKILGEFDLSGLTTPTINLSTLNALEEIRIKPNTVFVNFNILTSALLSAESIQSIIDGLATVEEQKTLKFHTDVVLKLTSEQLTTIANKNWIVG